MSAFNLFQELVAISQALEQQGLQYALCGGLALAIYAKPRATKDVDLLVLPEELDAVKTVVSALGFSFSAARMRFSSGIEVQRQSKIEGSEFLSLDLLLVNEKLRSVWDDRRREKWVDGELWVVSKRGLISLKRWAGRAQDKADLESLGELGDA